MSLPTFLGIGAQKAATTALHELLRQHPEVSLPEPKEANYFLDEANWHRGIDWYRSCFDATRAVRGDISPAYAMFPRFRHVPERAAATVPEAKLLYLVRDPIARIESAWAQLVAGGFEHRRLVDAVLAECHYVDTSRYATQLDRWLLCFPAESMLVLRAEDLAADPGGVLDLVLAHLGLEPGWRPADPAARWNETTGKVAVPARVRRIGAALDIAGVSWLADVLGPDGALGRRMARPIPIGELQLPTDLADDLRQLLAPEQARIESLVQRPAGAAA